MKRIKDIWQFLGNIYFTTFIFIMMMLDLLWAYSMLKSHPDLFHPINDMGFIKWMHTYGKSEIIHTTWLFVLIGLGALLSINTFVCTTERVFILFKSKSSFSQISRFIYKLSPHIMHYALLVMLFGYLVSYLYSETYLGNILLPGKQIRIPNSSITLCLDKLNIDYYEGTRLQYMENRAINVRAKLTLTNKEKQKTGQLSFNNPVWFYPYSLHLKDFAPKSNSSSMARRKYINIIIKKDPGMKYYFSGIIFFTVGLFIYLFHKISLIAKQEDH